MKKMNALPLAPASLLLLAGQPVAAGEPTFGDPTIYGRVNLTLEHGKVEGSESTDKFVDNGSRLGLRGGYGLGGETTAVYQIEGRLRHDDHWVVKSRDTWLGLQDANLGTVRYGMMEGPLYHATYDEISMHNHDSGRSSDALLAEDATGGRMSNSLYYRAPDMGPFKLELLHAWLPKDHAKPHSEHPQHDEFAITYEHGDSWIAGGYAESRNIDVNKALTFAAATVVKGVTIAGLYERSEIVSDGPVAYRNYARVAAKYPLGQHEFHVNYGVAGSLSTTPSSGATQATLAYNYNLTDKTKIYTFVTRIRNQANASYHFLDDTPNGASNSSLAIGVRHNF